MGGEIHVEGLRCNGRTWRAESGSQEVGSIPF
jgi:hypothetical protein